MHCHAHQENLPNLSKTPRNKKQKPKQHQTQTEHKHTKTKTHKPKNNTHHRAVTWQVPVYGWKGSIKARGDSLVSSRYMQNDILCAMMTLAHTINKKQDTHKNTMGQFSGCGKQQGSMRKPGIPPARDPRDHNEQPSRHDITHLTLWSKHRQRRVTTKWWENYHRETGEWNVI